MNTASKRKPAAKRAAAAKPVAAGSDSSAKPFLRFYHSAELRTKTNAVLTTLESARDPTAHLGALANPGCGQHV
ncbi:MAG: hypothetical protein KA760_01960 [Steroidobacteraceae bacterium]|nr:hypothetical protein [Pseudomonadota bacterium]MBP7608230.1 hypothetical protein [Steroidobacteraceae bacterium]MBP9129265.1 hypothetical protein [Steroidobacteraceae bacterium]